MDQFVAIKIEVEQEEEKGNDEEKKRTNVIHKYDKPPPEQNNKQPYARMESVMSFTPPENDDVLYCAECRKEYNEDCPIHGPLVVVQNAKVEESDPDRALLSLPPNLLVKKSSLDGARLGVFTVTDIFPGTTYGPYEGTEISDPQLANSSDYCWQIYKNGAPNHLIDGKDTSRSNWMRYVNCAPSDSDQNLKAFQYHGEIYYRCIKPILPKTELLVWYGDDCACKLGITRDNHAPIIPNMKTESDGELMETLFKCTVCEKTFHLEANVYKHMMVHTTAVKLYTCKLCERVFDCSTTLSRHMRVHTDKKPLQCEICGKIIQNSLLSEYMKSNTEESPIRCTNCEKLDQEDAPDTLLELGSEEIKQSSAATTSELHTTDFYPCDVCDKKFKLYRSVIRHKRVEHDTASIICTRCTQSFSNEQELKEHRAKKHARKVCPYCGKDFDDRYLDVHVAAHEGKTTKKRVCHMCDKSFLSGVALTYHINKVHTQSKPYSCTICQKAFRTNSLLKKHEKVCKGEQEFRCETCGKTFFDKRSQDRHIDSQHRLKKFICGCGKEFKYQSSIYKHYKKCNLSETTSLS